MPEPSSITASGTLASATATGVITIPILVPMGIDPSSIIPSLIGCTIVQLWLTSDPRTVRSVAGWTLGSVLFGSLTTPVVAPWFVVELAKWAHGVHPDAARAVASAILGGLAKPLVQLGQALFVKWADKLRGGDA